MEWGLIRLEVRLRAYRLLAAVRCPATRVDFALWVCPQYSFLDRPTDRLASSSQASAP